MYFFDSALIYHQNIKVNVAMTRNDSKNGGINV